MLLKAILIAVWAGFCYLDQMGPHLGFRKPLLAGLGVGIILGDVKQGLIIAATLELMWLGQNNVGAYQPPDVVSGAAVGVAIGILSGGGVAAGVAVAIPTSMLVQQVGMLVMTADISLVHKAVAVADEGEYGLIDKYHYMGGLTYFLSRAIPVFIAVYLGAPAIKAIMNFIPASVMQGLTVASKLLPAVGLAMLLSMMMKKDMWIFLLLGFVFAAYVKMPIIAVAMAAVAFAGIYDVITLKKTKEEDSNLGDEDANNDKSGGYDL